jgi:hypothetical protein
MRLRTIPIRLAELFETLLAHTDFGARLAQDLRDVIAILERAVARRQAAGLPAPAPEETLAALSVTG